MRTLVIAVVLLAAAAAGAYAVLHDPAGDAGQPQDASSSRDPDAGRAGRSDYEDAYYVAARDRFPAATDPAVVTAREATWLDDDEEVYGIVVGGTARAYPLRWLALHHAVNDRIGGVPVLVTYCVLCSSGACFDPVVEDQRLVFGVDGAWNGTATLYDRGTQSIWLELSGTCIRGPLAGVVLKRLPTGRHTTWADWRANHPDTGVMAPDPEIRYPAADEARSGSDHFPVDVRAALGRVDPRLEASALVYGVVAGGRAQAFPLARLRVEPAIDLRLGGVEITVWFDSTSRSAAAYRRQAGGRTLTFEFATDGSIRDRDTGSRWSMDGTCTSGALKGTQLERLDGGLAEWYGWSAHHPKTSLWVP